jgi:hypothetical protein
MQHWALSAATHNPRPKQELRFSGLVGAVFGEKKADIEQHIGHF